jgi:hypothetical protein
MGSQNTQPLITLERCWAMAVVAALLACQAAQAQTGAKGPNPDRWPVNGNGLPQFSRSLGKGPNQVTLTNGSHFRAIVQVRSGPAATEFPLEGKSSKTLNLPDGEYTIYLRYSNDARFQEGRSFTAHSGGVTWDDQSSGAAELARKANAARRRK